MCPKAADEMKQKAHEISKVRQSQNRAEVKTREVQGRSSLTEMKVVITE